MSHIRENQGVLGSLGFEESQHEVHLDMAFDVVEFLEYRVHSHPLRSDLDEYRTVHVFGGDISGEAVQGRTKKHVLADIPGRHFPKEFFDI